jgi:hypothetical protein
MTSPMSGERFFSDPVAALDESSTDARCPCAYLENPLTECDNAAGTSASSALAVQVYFSPPSPMAVRGMPKCPTKTIASEIAGAQQLEYRAGLTQGCCRRKYQADRLLL